MDQQQGNPFADILSKIGQSAPQQPEMGGEEMDDENQLMKGKNPDPSQDLMGALKSLQNYIGAIQDPEDIAVIRSIISAITKLIDKNQQRMTQSLPKDQEMLPRQQMAARQAMGKKILQ